MEHLPPHYHRRTGVSREAGHGWQSALWGGVAKITTSTQYEVIRFIGGGTKIGDFRLVRVYRFGTSAIMFHNANNDRIYPASQVWSAKRTIF